MRRRDILRIAPGAAAVLVSRRTAAAGKDCLVYWGTYTAGGPRYGTGESKGIYVSRFDAGNGKLTEPELAAETVNPSYLVIHPDGRYLYSVNEHIDHSGNAMGEISAFSIDRKTGRLVEINRVSSRGGMPCYICTDKTGAMVMAANWSTGSAAAFPVGGDGSLGEATGFYQHGGGRSGASLSSQPVQPRCHAVSVSPDNRFLMATDTGLNKIFVHRLNAAKAGFTPNEPPFLGLKSPANPRHLVFHPNGKWAYVANEANPGCTMLHYDAGRGVFEEGPVTRTVPEDYTDRASPAEAVMHPSGRFVFISNRGHDSIAVLKVHETSGALTLVEAFQPGGNAPRSFNIDPTGAWLVAMMHLSNAIVPLRIHPDTGRLTHAGARLTLPSPVCAKFLDLG